MEYRRNILILIFIAAIFVLLYLPTYSFSENSGLVFKRKCGQCHSIERSLSTEKTSERWEKTVDWMRNKQNTFSISEGEIIKRYLKKKDVYYPKRLFEVKCATCHPLNTILQQKRSPYEWEKLVKRERLKAVGWISLDESSDIAAYLGKYYKDKEVNNNILNNTIKEKKELTEKKCLLCHLYSTVFGVKRKQEEWIVINQRMQYKCPQWISVAEIEEITQFLIDTASTGK